VSDFLSDSPAVALTLAGHDPSSGAGITADLRTFAAHGLFGISAITALTVQSTLGVAEIQPVDAALLRRTLDHLSADLPPAGIKIGMLGSAEIAASVAGFLAARHMQQSDGKGIPIVLDPILKASSGAALLPAGALDVLHGQLLPEVTWITPNWFELAALTGRSIETPAEAETASHQLGQRHPHLHIVATAGDQPQPTDLLRLPTGEIHSFAALRIESNSTHGTGCAFSSALLARLICGDSPAEAVAAAKAYVNQAILRAPKLGHGKGPVDLLWPLRPVA
jgi:hydroxymethylpyrimidine/phosphomethylpyrimidine kinase